MAQFDVHQGSGTKKPPYFVVLQTDMLRVAETVVVAPLYPVGSPMLPMIPRLHPTFDVDGVPLVLVATLLASVRRNFLGTRIASLADRRDDIIAALDMLFTGV
jgi:toxin CcdB